MGLFKKAKKETFIVPVDGVVKPISESTDPVFAQKMMGDGLFIQPTNNEVYAPVDGVITLIFPTKHAIGIQSKEGITVLLHFGIDTVGLDGKGFEVFVQQNQKVTTNDLLWKADLEYIRANAVSDDLIIIFSEASENVTFEAFYGEHKQGDDLLRIL